MRYSLTENPTIFGKILRGEIPNRTVYEDEYVLAFHDIAPKAPLHVVIIPKAHLVGLNEAESADGPLLAQLLLAANAVAERLNVKQSGYRLITNAGKGAGQEVPHLHFHLLADPTGAQLQGF